MGYASFHQIVRNDIPGWMLCKLSREEWTIPCRKAHSDLRLVPTFMVVGFCWQLPESSVPDHLLAKHSAAAGERSKLFWVCNPCSAHPRWDVLPKECLLGVGAGVGPSPSFCHTTLSGPNRNSLFLQDLSDSCSHANCGRMVSMDTYRLRLHVED